MALDRRESGRQQFRAVTRMEPRAPTDPFTAFTMDTVFGEIWARPGLGRKERRLISLTTVALSGSETAMKVHFRAALDSGDLSVAEMDEFILHFAIYAGMPATVPAHAVLAELKTQLSAPAHPAG